MFKSCSRCGKIHPRNYDCKVGKARIYSGGEERELRSTYAWTQKSLEVREKANHLCEVCRDKGIYTYDGLEVHHIEKLKDNSSVLLDNRYLICLCGKCHTLADAGDIPKEYLMELAKRREEK